MCGNRPLHDLVAEGGGREADAARGAEVACEPVVFDAVGEVFFGLADALFVIDRDVAVEFFDEFADFPTAGAEVQHRQFGFFNQRFAQVHDDVGSGQRPGEDEAGEVVARFGGDGGCHQRVVAVGGLEDAVAGLQEVGGVGRGAGKEDVIQDAAGAAFAFKEDGGAQVLLQVADARRGDFRAAADDAEQFEVGVEGFAVFDFSAGERACAVGVVHDCAEQVAFVVTAEGVGGKVEAVFQAGNAGDARVRQQDDVRAERAGDLPVAFAGVGDVRCFQQAFHDDDVGIAFRRFKVLDDGFHQFVEIVRIQRLLHRFGADDQRVVADRARGMQQHGAAVIDVLAFDVVLHHRFVEADLDALAVKGVVEAENGRGKADAGVGGNDEDCFCHVVLLRR